MSASPSSDDMLIRRANERKPMLGNSASSNKRCNDRTISLTSKHLPWPVLKVKGILMMDYSPTQAWAKGVAPSASREGG
jgi:hypothetical protein